MYTLCKRRPARSLWIRVKLVITLALLSGATLFSQVPKNGVADEPGSYFAFINARIVVAPGRIISSGTLVIKEGKIVSAREGQEKPAGAIIVDLQGKSIYPSFIDIYSSYGIADARSAERGPFPQFLTNKKGPYYWNQAIKPETDASAMFIVDPKKAQSLRQLGFGSVVTHQQDGIMRGSSVFAGLNEGRESEVMIKTRVAAHYAFNKGKSTQDYPSSIMGSIALLRQAYYDAQWYAAGGSKDLNLSLAALNDLKTLPQVFEVSDRNNALRADKLGDEFSIQYIIKGGGDEYRRLDEIKKTGAAFILPMEFPRAYRFNSVWDERVVSLASMKHWEMAPQNMKLLQDAGIKIALTLNGLKDEKEFFANLRRMMEYGLSEADMLKALTVTPAELMKLDRITGTLETGKLASFIICSGPVFDKNTVIYENWVRGKAYTVFSQPDLRGTYSLLMDGKSYTLEITGGEIQNEAAVKAGGETLKARLSRENGLILLTVSAGKGSQKDILLSGWPEGKNIKGKGKDTLGNTFDWQASFTQAYIPKADSAAPQVKKANTPSPLLPYVYSSANSSYLIRNCTVWTCEQDGKLENTDVLVENGKISKVGKSLAAPGGITVIDGTGKHLTPGIIDEHSHIAISGGVNESTQSVTAEVRIGDVVNPDDINIYRQLSGGVTTAHLLHGSANSIGGQTALIRLKWGKAANELLYPGSDGFIKFALGENVKQSNWGDFNTIRFPQTRMGVEQVMSDAFTRALAYRDEWNNFKAGKTKTAPRKDLELDALVEILEKKRFITCHSYVQSEINMLMHLADSFGFRVNTFTHVLEGYKVADKMKKHGAGASTFADWWAYKYEVTEAIPYNAAILNRAGVITAINSDDAEMGRRLNQEAAKTIKYGGTSEEDALKMITLNPAKLLHIDKRTGSIKTGKDADLVLWNDHPLSNYARVEKTFIEGICYFDRQADSLEQARISGERSRLTGKMNEAAGKGEKTTDPVSQPEEEYHCDTIFDFWLKNEEEQ